MKNTLRIDGKPNDEFDKLTSDVYENFSHAAKAAIMTGGASGSPEATYVGCVATSATLTALSQLVGYNRDEDTNPTIQRMKEIDLEKARRIYQDDEDNCQEILARATAARTNHVTMLFSALLASRVFADSKASGTELMMTGQLGPHIVLEALELYEKITDKKPDDYLNPAMVKAARSCAVGSAEVLSDFLASRKAGLVPKNTN